MGRSVSPACTFDCAWPDHLHAECDVHGEIRDCGCGKSHATMPLLDLGEGVILPAVCRTHKRHAPCRGCRRDAERIAEVTLFGAARGNRNQ